VTVLPNRIVPESISFINKDGQNNHDWWLFFYNIYQQVLGTGDSSSPDIVVQLSDLTEIDARTVDQYSLIRRVESLERQVAEPEIFPSQLDLTRALLLSQDPLLPDPQPRAQPVQVIALTGSPMTWQALQDGTVVLSSPVSGVTVSRDNATYYTTAVGSVPVSRLDYLKISYSGSPVIPFFPR
jgi:hypothetical protein